VVVDPTRRRGGVQITPAVDIGVGSARAGAATGASGRVSPRLVPFSAASGRLSGASGRFAPRPVLVPDTSVTVPATSVRAPPRPVSVSAPSVRNSAVYDAKAHQRSSNHHRHQRNPYQPRHNHHRRRRGPHRHGPPPPTGAVSHYVGASCVPTGAG